MTSGGPADDELGALAAVHGVATRYEDDAHRRVDVDAAVVRAVLAQLGVDAGDAAAVRAQLFDARHRDRGVLPDPLVVRAGTAVTLRSPAILHTEAGRRLPLRDRLPPDLPLGYHTLVTGDREITVICVPARLPPARPCWGWMTQLYALHSAGSWGVGDLADLREFLAGSARLGAGVTLVSPVQAITPTLPVQRSPYSPSSRRFANPLYLRITEIPAFGRAPDQVRQRVAALAPQATATQLIDYDAVWTAKLAALEWLWPHADQPDVACLAPALRDFATFCALAERHGADWRGWPAALRHPGEPEVAASRRELADRVAFHAWLQGLCERQLEGARQAARDAGMTVGLIHDLPVGVDPAGADAWMLQDVLATEVTVGAPPDAFSQGGQDWRLPPWRPDRLAERGYRPFRDMIRAVLCHADGIRVDHVAGLWRLWWIPPGEPPSRGTYVHYDADALLGIMALEAWRAQAVVVGEDLGTVPDEVTGTLHRRGILSSAVLWFQRDERVPGGPLLPPARWPRQAMASVSTHDLPTAAGFRHAEHVRARAELGLLADPGSERARARAEATELRQLLRDEKLLGDPATESDEEWVVALHALLAAAPSTLLLTSPRDALAARSQPNLPGTVDEYPNWRIRLPVGLPELLRDPRLLAAVAPLVRARERGRET